MSFVIGGGESYKDYDAYLQALQRATIDPYAVRAPGWKSNLSDDLGDDYHVFYPTMPNTENSKYAEWKIWFEKHIPFFEGSVVLIGHSLGAMFLTRYFSEEHVVFSVDQIHLVSGAAAPEGLMSDDGGDFFVQKQEGMQRMCAVTENIFLYHSRDDEVVPYQNIEIYKKMLPCAGVATFEKRGHFLDTHFPELVANIEKAV